MQLFIEWEKYAYCKGMPIKFFFPSAGSTLTEAKLLCAVCPVQQDCLDFAIAHNEKGFWGGKTETERKKLPQFVTDYVIKEYSRLGLLENRQNSDAIVLGLQHKQ